MTVRTAYGRTLSGSSVIIGEDKEIHGLDLGGVIDNINLSRWCRINRLKISGGDVPASILRFDIHLGSHIVLKNVFGDITLTPATGKIPEADVSLKLEGDTDPRYDLSIFALEQCLINAYTGDGTTPLDAKYKTLFESGFLRGGFAGMSPWGWSLHANLSAGTGTTLNIKDKMLAFNFEVTGETNLF